MFSWGGALSLDDFYVGWLTLVGLVLYKHLPASRCPGGQQYTPFLLPDMLVGCCGNKNCIARVLSSAPRGAPRLHAVRPPARRPHSFSIVPQALAKPSGCGRGLGVGSGGSVHWGKTIPQLSERHYHAGARIWGFRGAPFES